MSETKHFDTIYIGSGHACWHGALLLKMAGQSVALVERDLLGGTCTNYGCDAKILLDSPIELAGALNRYRGIGLDAAPTIDWDALMAYKKLVIGGMPQALTGLFAQFGFDLIEGEAHFVDAHTIEVAGDLYTADHFVIGAGQNFVPLDVPGSELFADSRDFLSLDTFPDHVTFVGAGIISMEFASITLSLGKRVDVVTHGDRVLREYPRAYVDAVVEKMRQAGANFVMNADVTSLEECEQGLRLNLVDARDARPLEPIVSDYVLCAVGRRANVDGLGLEGLGVDFGPRGIRVDDHLRTAVPNIYASGDVIDKRIPKLTPTAEFESNYIASDILNPANPAIAYPVVPNLVFTLPRIAQVGVGIDAAKADPDTWRVEEVDLGRTMSWLNKNQTDEHATFVFDGTGHLVGAAIMSDEAGTYVDVLTIIINQRLTAAELAGMIFSFPTPTYALMSSLIPLFLKGA